MTIRQLYEPSCFTGSHEIEFAAVATARVFVAGRIAAAMKAAGKNQVVLATAAGLDQGYVSKLLKGQANLTLDRIDSIAGALGLSGSDLLRHAPDEKSDPHQGGSDVPASVQARFRELEQREREYKSLVSAVSDVAHQLTDALADVPEPIRRKNAAPRSRQPKARTRARNAS